MSSAFELNKSNGRLTITDSEKFIKMLASDAEFSENYDPSKNDPLEHYDALKKFGIKQLHTTAGDIPYSEHEFVINFAIAKTIKDFDPKFETNLLSFFWGKLRGEVSAYRSKRDRMQEKIIKVINDNDSVEYVYQNEDDKENTLIAVDTMNPEEQLIETDTHNRQMKALKMAFSGIPRDLQVILFEIGNGRKVREISEMLHIDELEISRKRNQGLSLILQRVLRSKHLSDIEKKEITDLHDIHLEENLEFESTL